MLRNISTRLVAAGNASNRSAAAARRLLTTSTPMTNSSVDNRSESTPKSTSAPIPMTGPYADCRSHSSEEGFYWRSGYTPVTSPDMTLDEYVWKNMAKWSNKVAIACGVTGRKYTYAKLRDHCAAVAVRLHRDYNLQRGDVVAISMPNVPEYAIIVLGALEAGLTLTVVNPAYTAAEHAKQFQMTNTKVVFGMVDTVPMLLEASNSVAGQPSVVAMRSSPSQEMPAGVRDLAELIDLHDVDFKRLGHRIAGQHPTDVCIIPFSSGTTGLPKGVELTHNNITINCEMIDSPMPEQRMMLPTTNDFQDVVPSVLPLYHIYGFVFTLISKLAFGCKVVTLPRFEPASFLNSLAEHKATFLTIVPPLLMFLANDSRATSHHMASVRSIICGAASSGSADADRLRDTKARSVQFIQAYGMTEASPLALMSSIPSTDFDSIGRPVPSTEVKIVNVNDPLASGLDVHQEGELLIRGPQIMRGYLNNAEATAGTMAPGGWLRSGDIAAYDETGKFFIRDRVKELIKVNALQVPPAELEEVLRTHPAVLDAGVIGIPHQRSGEVPRAFIVVRPEALAANADGRLERDLAEFVAKRVAKYKRLEGGVKLVDALPRSPTGKILRRELKLLNV